MFLIKKTRSAKAATGSVTSETLFVKILQCSQENTCVELSNKLWVCKTWNFIKKKTPTQMFSCKYCEISKITFWRASAWGCFWSDLRIWFFRAVFLDSHFQNHPEPSQTILSYITKILANKYYQTRALDTIRCICPL